MKPWRIRSFLAIVLMVLIAAGCAGDDDSSDDAADATSSSSEVDTGSADSTATPSSLTASTVSSATSEPPTSASTSASTTSTTEAVTTTEPSTSSTTVVSSTTSSPPGTVIDGGSFFDFSSPSGNIACYMTADVASCWIGQKAWTIEQPSGPDCEISDWGNAVEVDADGPSFPCYTDMPWNIAAPALPYGDAVEVGSLRCESAESGVTCRNAAGNGFTAARAAVRLF